MNAKKVKLPFFEIGPKSYLYGEDILELAKAADAASEKYGVDIIFTTPVVDIRRVREATLFAFSALGGSVAILITMLFVRHKTRHKRFMIGIPIIIAVQTAAISALVYFGIISYLF